MPHYNLRPVPTVAAYFEQKLGAPLEKNPKPAEVSSPSHPDFHIDTGCGAECRAAIDASAEILQHLSNAFGEPGNRMHPKGPPLRAAVIEAARNVVLCYVYG
jgi:hypothetical protein